MIYFIIYETIQYLSFVFIVLITTLDLPLNLFTGL